MRRDRHRDGEDDAQDAARDTEEALVAAFQESDTTVEALHDSNVDAGAGAPLRWKLGIAGIVMALIGLVVARRRS